MIVMDDSGKFIPRGATGFVTQDDEQLNAFDRKIIRRAYKGGNELSRVCVGDSVVFQSPEIPASYCHIILH